MHEWLVSHLPKTCSIFLHKVLSIWRQKSRHLKLSYIQCLAQSHSQPPSHPATHTRTHTHTHTHTHKHTHTHTHTHRITNTQMFLSTCLYRHTQTHICTCTHRPCTHACRHLYKHTLTPSSVWIFLRFFTFCGIKACTSLCDFSSPYSSCNDTSTFKWFHTHNSNKTRNIKYRENFICKSIP